MRLLVILVSALFSYETIAESRVIYDTKEIDIVANHTNENVSYIKGQEFCAGTGSDYARTGGFGISLSDKDTTEQGGVGISDSHGVESLGGRTSALLITRELMYRACELSLNTSSNRAQTIEIYKMFLNSIETITALHLGQGTDPLAAPGPQEAQSN